MIVSRAAIRRPVTVAMVFIGLVIIGGFVGLRMAVEQYPEHESPYIGLGIPYGSTSTQEIERNVTRPVEEILSTIGGIERMYSRTRTGFVWVSMDLEEGEDAAAKGIEAKELVESIRHRLPDDIRHIRLGGQSEDNAPILSFVISAPALDPEDVWRLLDARVRVPLERVPGVNSVQLFGAEQQYVRIALDPGRLEAHGLDVLDVQRRLAEENFYLSAGSIDLARLETQVRPLGRFEGLEDILDLPVRPGLTVADIADVEYVPQDEADQRRLNGEDALGVSVYKKPEANLVAVASDVQEAMDDALKDPELADASFLTASNQAESVLRSLETLIQNGAIGGTLSAIVLFAFIRRLVPALLISATVPLALIATLGAMYFAGLTLNVLSLVGLMLAVGLLVDNSVVVSESIALRRRNHGLSPFEAADRGVTEVGLAITAGTLTTIVVFVPTLFMDVVGTATAMRNVAVPLCTSIAASLIIATTLIPALLARMPEGRGEPKHRVFDRLGDVYERVVLFTLRHRFSALLVAALLAGAGWWGYTQLDVVMEPEEDDQTLELRFWVRGTMALERMEGIVDEVEGSILGSAGELGIADVYTTFDYDRGDVLITLREDGQYAAATVKERILEMMPSVPNVTFYFRSKGRGGRWNRDGDGGMGVRLVGDSTAKLMEISESVIAVLQELPYLNNVHTQSESGRQEVVLRLKPEQAGQLGVTASTLGRSVSVALGGIQLRRGLDQGGWEDSIQLEIEDRQDMQLEDLLRLPIFLPGGGTVALEALADVEFRPSIGSVRRENRETAVSVEFGLKDITPMEARQRVEAIMRNFQMPTGYRWEMGRDFDYESEQFLDMLVMIGVAVLLVYMLMAALFESALFPSAVLFSIAYSAVGVMLFLWVTDTPLTMMAMIGMVLLAGIVVNNGIVLLNRIFQLVRRGSTREEAIVQAGRDRLRPILMTAATTVAGLIPLAVGDVRIGGTGESYMPMARSIIGGLTFATAVTLLLTPLLFVHFDNLKRGATAFWRRAVPTT
ncbi:MAG: efflux RND transporter permease subunit [Gammaproteobacteria bacterium]|nr:efflux RND transporter permease subunit [Gammaproteobacteria bacterium]